MLLLSGFLFSWSEVWMIDYNVLRQEARAKKLLQAIQNNAGNSSQASPNLHRRNANRNAISRVTDYLSYYTAESVANFYSPLASPSVSDDEEDMKTVKLSPQGDYAMCSNPRLSHLSKNYCIGYLVN